MLSMNLRVCGSAESLVKTKQPANVRSELRVYTSAYEGLDKW